MGGAAAGRALRGRAAVTTGEAAVTIGATGQGMVAGDLVNVAARLQSRAPVGGVLVDRTTRDRASTAASFRAHWIARAQGKDGSARGVPATSAADGAAGGPAARTPGRWSVAIESSWS